MLNVGSMFVFKCLSWDFYIYNLLVNTVAGSCVIVVDHAVYISKLIEFVFLSCFCNFLRWWYNAGLQFVVIYFLGVADLPCKNFQ